MHPGPGPCSRPLHISVCSGVTTEPVELARSVQMNLFRALISTQIRNLNEAARNFDFLLCVRYTTVHLRSDNCYSPNRLCMTAIFQFIKLCGFWGGSENLRLAPNAMKDWEGPLLKLMAIFVQDITQWPALLSRISRISMVSNCKQPSTTAVDFFKRVSS